MADASEGRTLYDKVWDAHVVRSYDDGASLIYIDRHLVQEVSSPQAFAGMQSARRALRRVDLHLAVADHAVPTKGRDRPMPDGLASKQLRRLEENARAFDIPYIPMADRRHGIVHVIGPELGFTLPGSTLVCGDSHTCTHGALGALSFGIGASECEMVFATQCLRQTRQKRMLVRFTGKLSEGVAAKDAVLAFIRAVGVGGSAGHAIEYGGPGIGSLGIEARMTLCNMAVEAGSRVAMVAPDDLTFAYVEGRPYAPTGPAFERALDHWRSLPSDADATFDRIVPIDLSAVAPHVTWGTTPEEASPINGHVPDPDAETDIDRRARLRRSLDYMGLKPGTRLEDIPVDRVFIGSCTNARLDDLRAASRVVAGRRVSPGVKAIVVPGSATVRRAAESEGLDKLFLDAGFEWRESGCSMCVAMNDDRLAPGERCASTSNRNFEGRQGRGGRTHLMSPSMAAAAAITGHLADVRTLLQ